MDAAVGLTADDAAARIYPGGRSAFDLETVQSQAWPAVRTVHLDGWLLRLSHGPTGRSNSINALARGKMDPAARLAEALIYFRQAGLLPIVRVTPAVEPGFDRLLERLGWQRYNQTSVMMGGLASAASDPDVQITREPDTRWIDALVLTGASPARMVEHRALLARQQAPGFYAWIGSIDAPEAIGMATVSGGLVVLFEIATHPAHRRKGLARRLCRSLLAAGLAAGADHALLQVVADNAAAKSLYQSLGFKELYDYWYRRAPY